MKKTKNILNIIFLFLTLGLLFLYVSLPEYGEHVLGYYICSNGMLFTVSGILLIYFTLGMIKKLQNGASGTHTNHLKKIIAVYIVTTAGIGLIIYGIIRTAFYYIAISSDEKVAITIFLVSFILITFLLWLLLFPITKRIDTKYNIPMRNLCIIVLAYLMLLFGVIMCARNLIKAQKDIVCGRQSMIIHDCYYVSSHSKYRGTTYDLYGYCESGHIKFDITGIGENTLDEMEGKRVRVSFYPHTRCVYSAEIVE
ncbi:MAG: hypothetical protein ACI4GW_10395 [Lachnospiraceae bacterium]